MTMKTTSIFLIFVSSSMAFYNPYENASSSKYLELFAEFRTFVIKAMLATLKRGEIVRFPSATTSCENRCGEKRIDTSFCHCDDQCQMFRDCCCDFLKTCKPTTSIVSEKRDELQCISDLHHQHVSRIPWYDVYQQHGKMPLLRIKGHSMISTCPNCSTELRENCLNPANSIPVEGPNNQTYKNKFCALGNGVRPNNTAQWRYKLFCNKSGVYREREKLQNVTSSCGESEKRLSNEYSSLRKFCTWYNVPPLNKTKRSTVCSPVKTCPQTPKINITVPAYEELKLKCQAYMQIVFHNRSYYKNFHCALCHGVAPTDIENPPIILHKITLSLFFEISKTKSNYGNENNCTGSVATVSKWENVFHLMGASISMVTLMILLALYSLVKALRTTPGKIIMGLSFTILTYQTLLLMSSQFTEKSVACSIFAIFLHYAVLSSFAWMSVMGFDVWKTFGRNSQQPMVQRASSFLRYSMFVIISPLVIVLTSITLDRTGVMLVYWRHGQSDSCWIVDNMSSILFVKTPMGLSLGLNVIALIWTIIGITRVRNQMLKFNSTGTHAVTKNIKMYGKMSVVMGLTWILGFGIEYSVILRYTYLIVNSLQGFFIFVAFVINKRVLEKCKKHRRSSQSQSSKTNIKKTSADNSI